MANSILSPVSLTSFFDNATGEARQANLFFYKAQTLDPIVVYTDSLLRIPHASPVVTTGWGRVPPVYVGEFPDGYRVRAFDQYQTLIEDLDSLPGAPPPADTVPDPTPVTPDQLHATGDIKMMWSNHTNIVGWLECNGKTIGDTGSNATGSQSADNHSLFVWLWENDVPGTDPNTPPRLPVIPSKGASAQGDWESLKAITLPDYRGRFMMGLDGFDSANNVATAGRADDGLFLPRDASGNPDAKTTKPWQIGAYGGEDVHKLVVTELAVHPHDWVDQTGHTHYVWDPGHVHPVTNGNHQHPLPMPPANQCDNSYGLTIATSYGGRVLVAAANNTPNGNTLNAASAVSVNTGTTGLTLMNALWNSTPPNYGSVPGNHSAYLTYIGLYNAADNLFHNWTSNQGGDVPHNTLPPFATVCVYIKL